MSSFRKILSFLSLLLILQPRLLYGQSADESWKIFYDSQVARVDITINPADLLWIYQNVTSDSVHVAKIRFRNQYIDETVDSVGLRLRGNTSRTAKKKSFKVEFNGIRKGERFYGLKDLNLNGEHNDPSIIRSKLSFDLFTQSGLHASRAAHCEVYINGKYYGLYISVEQIDDTFIRRNFKNYTGNLWKCLYPADLKYLGENQQSYINLNESGRPAYDLQTNGTLKDFSKLVRFIRVLNNTSDAALPDSLESIISIADVLHYYAINVFLGNWDTYWSLMNNYYLYHDPVEDFVHLLPYDCDNTFGIDWFGTNWSSANPYNYPKVSAGGRPLAERLMANAQYRNLYTHFLSFYNQKRFSLSNWESSINRIQQVITSSAMVDTFRALDYGFTTSNFFDSYSANAFSLLHVKFGLKQFVNIRSANLPGQLSYQSAKPIVYAVQFTPRNPLPGDSIKVSASVFADPALASVTLTLTPSGGNAKSYSMKADPVTNTKIAYEFDRWTLTLPPFGAGTGGSFVITAKDVQSREQTYPRKGKYAITVNHAAGNSVLINEFLADNQNANPDPTGEFDDWLELYNPTSQPVLLTGKYLSDDPANLKKWRFTAPNLILQPNNYLIIWCDEQASQPGLHVNFKLNKAGEFICITDTNGITVLDSLTFTAQKTDTSFGRFPSGSAQWRFLYPTPGAANAVSMINPESAITGFWLAQNYPNPFNPVTTIRYSVPILLNSNVSSPGNGISVLLRVYDALGRTVAKLVDSRQIPGEYSEQFDASQLASGTYFYELRAGEFRAVKKMSVIK